MGQLIHEELSRDILAAAMKVHATLKPGLDEKLYENALLIELVKRGHRAEQVEKFLRSLRWSFHRKDDPPI